MSTSALDALAPRTPRRFTTIPVKRLVIDPTKNYRWGSEAAMRADLTRYDRTEDGEQVCSYEVLKVSMRDGVEEPIGVIRRADGFHVVYGFTRAVAAQELKLVEVPAAIYEEGISAGEVALLQMRENSEALKRRVNWVAEVRMFERLRAIALDYFNALPKTQMPRDEHGNPLAPYKAAVQEVCERLGRKPTTMHIHRSVLTRLDPRVVKLSEEGKLSFKAAVEFYSGDANVAYDTGFVTHVLNEVKRNDPKLDRVTPLIVRSARQRVYEWIQRGQVKDGTMVWRGGKAPRTTSATRALIESNRLSPAACRDVAVNLAARAIRTTKLNGDSTEEAWEALRRDATWFRIVGVGIGAGDVILADNAVDGDGAVDVDLPPEQCDSYALLTVVHAALREQIRKRCRGAFADWLRSVSTYKVGSIEKRIDHRGAFFAAVQTTVHGVNRSFRVKRVVDAAWKALQDSGVRFQYQA